LGPAGTAAPIIWRVRDRILNTDDHTLVMGVVNVTPDSFSDGGLFASTDAAVAHALDLVGFGADIIDVGGESTRPGSEPVASDDEMARVLPVVRAVADTGVAVSIDTSKPEVAAAAIDAGAVIVNDITSLGDERMGDVVADASVGLVLMHMQGSPRTMQDDPRYDDVVSEVTGALVASATAAEEAGVARDAICIDPGIGFGKRLEHNLALLGAIPELAATGYPVLVGASRKSFLEHLLGPLSMEEREAPTVAAHVMAIAGGAAVIRVHDVVKGLRTARVTDAIVRSQRERRGHDGARAS
jgi:dihydropteroate synthase